MGIVSRQSRFSAKSSRLGNSIAGVLIGIILLLVGIVLPFIIEGTPDAGLAAEKAVLYQAGVGDGNLVYTVGKLQGTGNYPTDSRLASDFTVLGLRTSTEVYGWYVWEEKRTASNGDEITELKGRLEWMDDYRYKVGSWSNVEISASQKNATVSNSSVNGGQFDLYDKDDTFADITINGLKIQSPGFAGLPFTNLDASKVVLGANERAVGNFIYPVGSAVESPSEGNYRLNIQYVPNEISGTFVGELKGDSLYSHTITKSTILGVRKGTLYQFFPNYTQLSEVVESLKTSHQSFLWIMRIVYFVILLFAFLLISGPLTALLDFIPIFGHLGKAAIGIFSFIGALILTVIVDVLAIILNNWLALIVVVALLLLILILGRKKQKAKAE
jgi:hypothetical protein